MRNVFALLRRELSAYFSSVLGYVVLVIFLLIMGRTFLQIITLFQDRPVAMGPMEALFGMFWFPSLFLIPAITMRLFSEEKKLGTLEMLMTAPVTDFQVVVAKFLGAVCLYTFMWALTGLYVLILRHFATGPSLDVKQILAGYVCILFMGQFFIAIGLLASSLTKNQIIGAVVSVSVIFTLIIVTFWQAETSAGAIAPFFRYISPFQHITDFARGIMDVRTLVLYVTGTIFTLFATTRVLESRKWR